MSYSIIRVYAIVFIGALLLASGCVSASKYRVLQAQFDEAAGENKRLGAEVEAQSRKAAGLENAHAIEVAKREEREQVKQAMIGELREEINAREAEIEMLKGLLRVEFVEKLFFDSGSVEIKPDGRKILARIAPILKRAEGHTIRIVGHADELPPGAALRKKYPSNWELSVARAASVIQVLQWGYKVDPKRMVVEGVAHYKTLPAKSEKGVRAANRSVEIILVPSR